MSKRAVVVYADMMETKVTDLECQLAETTGRGVWLWNQLQATATAIVQLTIDGIRLKDATIARLQEQVEEAEAWVHDLQAGMYINCVYCGHRYGPDDEVPATLADALKEHIEQCPKHPMSALKALAERRKEAAQDVLEGEPRSRELGACERHDTVDRCWWAKRLENLRAAIEEGT